MLSSGTWLRVTRSCYQSAEMKIINYRERNQTFNRNVCLQSNAVRLCDDGLYYADILLIILLIFFYIKYQKISNIYIFSTGSENKTQNYILLPCNSFANHIYFFLEDQTALCNCNKTTSVF